jgi:hypothetical protein
MCLTRGAEGQAYGDTRVPAHHDHPANSLYMHATHDTHRTPLARAHAAALNSCPRYTGTCACVMRSQPCQPPPADSARPPPALPSRTLPTASGARPSMHGQATASAATQHTPLARASWRRQWPALRAVRPRSPGARSLQPCLGAKVALGAALGPGCAHAVKRVARGGADAAADLERACGVGRGRGADDVDLVCVCVCVRAGGGGCSSVRHTTVGNTHTHTHTRV